MYIDSRDYGREGTKYKEITTFYLKKSHAKKIFETLLTTNRITLQPNTYINLRRGGDDYDPIYIRALYYSDGCDTHILVCNDARRRIVSLYKERLESEQFKIDLLDRISTRIGYGPANNSFFNRFISLLSIEEAFIAGSFPLQVFIKENWSSSDLDVFVTTEKGFQKLCQFMRKEAVAEKILTMELSKAHNKDPSLYQEFNEVYEYVLLGGFTIQIIYTKRRGLKATLGQFDFDFCKIGWDFSENRLTIINRQSIETRSCVFDLELKNKHKCAERLKKYEARGFTVINAKEMLLHEQELIEEKKRLSRNV